MRVSWAEATELIAAAHVYTIKTYGPDRVAGFSPIPAMSMVSFAAGSRFVELIGGVMTSFYDWYADLPVASPQVFGDQTDVPESGDWWDAAYLVMWGSNVPVTRTPDAHWMAEVRYRGTKVVSVSPDYADNTKFADEWMPCAAGTDGALAMAMGHVILSECFVHNRVPFFVDYVRQYTDLPFLVKLEQRDGVLVPGKNLTAADLGPGRGERRVQTGAAGRGDRHRRGAEGLAGIPLRRRRCGQVEPGSRRPGTGFDRRGARRADRAGSSAALRHRRRARRNPVAGGAGAAGRRAPGVHRVRPDARPVRGGPAGAAGGTWPTGYDDAAEPYTPAWQEPITGVSAAQAVRVAREFARNAVESGGRSMIIMGAGICQWFHGDATYRAVLALLLLTGSMGRNGGGWAHYVGQEKCRPVTGWAAMAMGTDWCRPPRQMAGTSYWYTHTDQWRYDGYRADALASPLGRGRFRGKHTMDVLTSAVAMGWTPFYPQFDRSSLEVADEARAAGKEIPGYVAEQLAAGELKLAVTDPDNPRNWPRVLDIWRANLLGSSSKGNEYFLRHLLGTTSNLQAQPAPEGLRPNDVAWTDDIPEGKVDLLMSIDFRMTSTTLLSDVVLPAATWYEKGDLSSTDMHPFIHAFSPAIDPPWETRSDYEAFGAIARVFSALAARHLGTRTDVVLGTLQHDTPGAMVSRWHRA